MRIKIQGRQPLRGTYRAAGNSNSALALLAAALLTDSPVTLRNVPDTVGVGLMLEVGMALGLQPDSPDIRDGVLHLRPATGIGRALSREQTDVLGPILLYIAPLLARRRHAHIMIDYAISRIQTHLTALRDLGCTVHIDGGQIDIKAEAWDRREIILTQTSVTATAITCMVAAALGKQTVILNAASEPHIVDLLNLLAQFGVGVEGAGSNLLMIRGWGGADPAIRPAAVTLAPDHIEIGSVAAMAALTGGRVTIENTRQRDLRMIAKVYERLGVQLDLDESTVFVPRHEAIRVSGRDEDVDAVVESAPWPGFPSDLIGIATLIATQSSGTTLIHEKLFPNRLLFVDRLLSMGAQIVLCDPHRAIVVGPTPLRADYIDNPDVRTGLGMLAAALCAEGESVIDTAEAFDRTFDHVLDKLPTLGADIRRVEG